MNDLNEAKERRYSAVFLWIYELGFAIQRLIASTLKLGTYALVSDRIRRSPGGLRDDCVLVSDIVSWYVHYEMGFDIVIIALSNGEEKRWIDMYGDLISILNRVAKEKRVEDQE
jgi:hypothetical protein